MAVREGGDDADHATDGAKEQRRQARCLAVRQLHDEGAMSEAVHKVTQMVLTHHLARITSGSRVPNKVAAHCVCTAFSKNNLVAMQDLIVQHL